MNEEVEEYLYRLTLNLKKESVENFSASKIADYLNLSRSTVSGYLNQGVKEKKLLKIKSYPVIFIHKEAFEKNNFKLLKDEYPTLNDIWLENENDKNESKDVLESIIGANGSLKEQIVQIKTASLYPHGGLPIMILGSSGSGKTFFAKKIYEYLLEKNILEKSAPFLSLNCAQYFNNPELLSSVLFGYTKGAFTGAEMEKAGLFDQADGGVLFLDEIHRLSEEGQEKLFTFMDSGIYSPIGDDSIKRTAKIRLVFATTEDIYATFLPTFIRRLPVIMTLPDFHRRPFPERLELVDRFFLEESKILDKSLTVSGKVINFLLNTQLDGNVGTVRNMIKYACGYSYARNIDYSNIPINITDLPAENIAMVEFKFTSNNNFDSKRIYNPTDRYVSSSNRGIDKIQKFFEWLIEDFKQVEKTKIKPEQLIEFAIENVNIIMDELNFYHSTENKHTLFEFFMNNIRLTIQNINEKYGVYQEGNKVIAIANYLYVKNQDEILFHSSEWTKTKNKLLRFINTNIGSAVWITKQLLQQISSQIDHDFYDEDIIFIAFYLHGMNFMKEDRGVHSIVLAHGYSTASSLANVANRMLKENIFYAYDMPLDITISEIEQKVLQYIEDFVLDEGLILLVDMGSLQQLSSILKNKISGPLLVIDSVNAPLLLEIGSYISDGSSVLEISEKVMEDLPIKKELILPESNKKKVLLTCCYTGMGTAVQIQEILQKSMSNLENELLVIPYDYKKLETNKLLEFPFQTYDVIAIIGTEDPKVDDIPYIGIDQIMSGEALDLFIEIVSQVAHVDQTKLKKDMMFNFSLKRLVETLTILDPEKVLLLVQDALDKIEKQLKVEFEGNKRLLLCLHASCMIERILRKEDVDEQSDIEVYKKNNEKYFEIIKHSFEEIEKEYTISINDLELRLLFDILKG